MIYFILCLNFTKINNKINSIMEIVEINFEEVALAVTYEWFENHCKDLNLQLNKMEDEDIYIIYICDL